MDTFKKITAIRENKIVKLLLLSIKVFVIIIAIAFVLVVSLQRFSDNRLSFFNYRMFTVVSGSMEPTYVIGDVLFAKDVPANEIKELDNISFLGTTGSFKNKVITHQVLRVIEPKEEGGKYSFRTKGLRNVIEDPEIVHEDQLYGVIVYKSKTLSTLYKIISTSLGFYFLIIIPIMYAVGSELLHFMLERAKKKYEPHQ